MKMKVNRLKLIAAIEVKAKELQGVYKKALDEWEKAKKVAKAKYLRDLSEWVEYVKADKFDENKGPTYYSNSGQPTCNWPTKPAKPYAFEDLISQLELAADEFLQLDDNSDYFQFLRK